MPVFRVEQLLHVLAGIMGRRRGQPGACAGIRRRALQPRERKRPTRPTAEHLEDFTMLERDWACRTTDAAPIRPR